MRSVEAAVRSVMAVVCASSACCAAPEVPATPPRERTPAVAAPAAVEAPTTDVSPSPTYERGTPTVALVAAANIGDEGTYSPDRRLVATRSYRSTRVRLLDVERELVVGETSGWGGGPLSAPLWISDDRLVVQRAKGSALYDGRTGASLGFVPGGVHGAVMTRAGVATLRTEPSGGARLVTYAQPDQTIARVDLADRIDDVIDLGEGSFACQTQNGLFAFEPTGAPRWSRPGGFRRALVRATKDGGQRVVEIVENGSPPRTTRLLASTGAPKSDLEERHLLPIVDPSWKPSEPRSLTDDPCAKVTPDRLDARLPAGPIARYGRRETAEGEKVATSDHDVKWEGTKITIASLKTGATRTLDMGSPVTQVELHPNGRALLTSAHGVYVGRTYSDDPRAAVRVFDLATGAKLLDVHADEVDVTADGRRLVVEGHRGAAIYDATTYARLNHWDGPAIHVHPDPTGRFALVVLQHDATPSYAFTPKQSFVQAIGSPRRLLQLREPGGLFTFSPSGALFGFAATVDVGWDVPSDAVSLYDLPPTAGDKPARVVDLEDPTNDIRLLSEGILALQVEERDLVLRRLSDDYQLRVIARPEGKTCRLFAVDAAGRFQGDPGKQLGLRHGSDLRKSAVELGGAAIEALRDDRLIEKMFAK